MLIVFSLGKPFLRPLHGDVLGFLLTEADKGLSQRNQQALMEGSGKNHWSYRGVLTTYFS